MNSGEKDHKFALVVEGDADKKFLKDYCAEIFSVNLTDQDFIKVGTDWRGLGHQKTQLVRRLEEGRVLLLILDADTPSHEQGGFENRYAAICEWLKNAKIDAKVFLWPNNSAAGQLESMLQKIIAIEHSQIFSCFEKYEDCLRASNKGYVTPDEGAKIYAYVEALGVKKDEKNETKRNYKNSGIWDLKSDFLLPLNQFLDPHVHS
jgi:hypothetical protein